MNSLYLRIFVGFWLVIALTLAITVGVNRATIRAELDRGRVETLRSSLNALAAQAQQTLTEDGVPGLHHWLEIEVAGRPEPSLLIVGPDGAELLGRALPPGSHSVQRMLRRIGEGDEIRRRGPVRVLQAPDGDRYLLFVPLREPRGSGRWFVGPEARRNFLVVALLVSGGICFFLSRYLTRPVRALRHAGRQLAAGDLGARVGPAVGARRDELGALAREFDRMAERIEALVGNQQRLLRDVSHELRSPLTRLQTAVGLIRQRRGDVPDADLDRIEREAERLDGLIGQILSFSRLQAMGGIGRQPVDVTGLLQEVVDDANFEGRASGREVTLDCTASPPVAGDEALLRSAIENVVRNALGHARRSVSVGLAVAGDRVSIAVADDGPGVPAAELPRLFEPFYQVQKSEGAPRGTGLGLAIVARAVELHGGSVTARNADGGGLVIELRLPLAGSSG